MIELAREADREGSKIETEASDGTAGVSTAVGAGELPSLRAEGERLKQELDNAKMRAELAALTKPPTPWWRRGTIVTTLTAIIAAVIPVTTAVQAHYEKERELALQEGKQAHEIRTSYLDRLDKPGARMRTLRFVLATATDPALKEWAQDEKKEVQSELDIIRDRIKEIEAETERDLADQKSTNDESSSKVIKAGPGSTSKVRPAGDAGKGNFKGSPRRSIVDTSEDEKHRLEVAKIARLKFEEGVRHLEEIKIPQGSPEEIRHLRDELEIHEKASLKYDNIRKPAEVVK